MLVTRKVAIMSVTLVLFMMNVIDAVKKVLELSQKVNVIASVTL